MMVDVRRSRARDVGIVLVLALLAVDAVLVVMALRDPPDPPAVTVADTPVPTASVSPKATTPQVTETPTPTPTEAQPVLATGRELPLAVLDAERAVRSPSPGQCGQVTGIVELTQDGGETWTESETAPDLAVVRVRIREGEVWFVGADENCVTDFARTEDGGENWERTGRTRGVWHLFGEPGNSEVHAAPDSVIAGPCVDQLTVELESPDNEETHVLCADGSVHRGAGGEWSPIGTAPGALALGLRDGLPVVAVAGTEACAGLAVRSVEGDVPTDIGCAIDAPTDGVALAFAPGGGAGFLVAGGLTWTTEDGGANWKPTT